MKKIVLCLAISMLLFTSTFDGLPKVSSSSELIVKTGNLMRRSTLTASNTSQILQNFITCNETQSSPAVERTNNKASEVFMIIVEKNHMNTTFTITFTESALATNSIMLPSEVKKAVNGSSNVIVEDGSGSYGGVLQYDTFGSSYVGASTYYHLSAADAINTDSALTALAGLISIVGGIIAAVTGGLAIPIVGIVAWVTDVTAWNYNTIYSSDHNPDKSFDFWTDMVTWRAFWDNDYIVTPYNIWFATIVGAYVVSSYCFTPRPPGAVGGGGKSYMR